MTFCVFMMVSGLCISSFAETKSGINSDAEQHYEKANELYKLADYNAAITEFEQVIEPAPKSAIAQNAKYWIGQIYFETRQFDTALTTFQELINEFPDGMAASTTKNMIERVQQAKKNKSFFEAVKKGDIEQVRLLIAQGADLNWKDKDGSTPLHEAAGDGWIDVVRLLLEKGANVKATDATGQTPLHRASRWGSRDICAWFLAKGASVKATDSLGNTPLHAALGRQEVNRRLFEFLLAKGADVNARNEQGETPLHLACTTRRPATYTQQRAEAVDILLAHGAEIDAPSKTPKTRQLSSYWPKVLTSRQRMHGARRRLT